MYIFYIFLDIRSHHCPLTASVNQVLVGDAFSAWVCIFQRKDRIAP